MPKVSIIVPVYNVEKYLAQCIDSILSQTFDDIEIICIDDGSTDSSGKILDVYAQSDNRIVVVHRKNFGYGAALNCGLDLAKGEYIGIVESDDCILPEMYEVLYETATAFDLDMVKSDAFYWIESEEFVSRIHINKMEKYYDKVLDSYDKNKFFNFYMNIWTGIYKKSFLDENSIRFHESAGASYQDNGFWIQTCIYANRAMWVNKAFYLYRQDNPMASVKSHQKMLAMSQEYDYLENMLCKRRHNVYLPYCNTWRLIRDVGCINRISDELKIDFCNQIKIDYEKYAPFIQGLSYVDDFLSSIVQNPEGVVEQMIIRKHELTDRLKAVDNIVIYGAGEHGETIFRILFDQGLMNKVSHFVVSSNIDKTFIGKKPVISIDKVVANNLDSLYIIAVAKGSKAYNEMIQTLTEYNVSNYLSGSDLEACFYIA